MTPEKKVEIRDIVEHFGDQKITQDVLTSYCERKGYEQITLGTLDDYRYQVKYDVKMKELMPRILALFTENMKYVGEFDSESAVKEQNERDLAIRVGLVKLLEEFEMPYRMAEHSMTEIGSTIKGIFDSAGMVASNKAAEVLAHMARERFGGEIHMGHIAKYAEDAFKNAGKNKTG